MLWQEIKHFFVQKNFEKDEKKMHNYVEMLWEMRLQGVGGLLAST